MMLTHHGAHGKLKLFHLEDGGFNHQRDYKAVEVKIDGEMRLFTNIFYKNSQEELLLNFDHYGNHSEAENFVNNHKLVEALGNLTVL